MKDYDTIIVNFDQLLQVVNSNGEPATAELVKRLRDHHQMLVCRLAYAEGQLDGMKILAGSPVIAKTEYPGVQVTRR